jgi:hypothetical protein
VDADNLAVLLSESFKPDEDFVFGPQSILDQNQITFHSQESLSIDEVCIISFLYEDVFLRNEAYM